MRKVSDKFVHYHPHPKDDGRLCFHRRLSVNICRRGGYPIQLTKGYPISCQDGGYLYPRSGWGVPQDTPCLDQVPGQDKGYPIPGQGRGGEYLRIPHSVQVRSQVRLAGTSSQVRGGYCHPGQVPGQDGTATGWGTSLAGLNAGAQQAVTDLPPQRWSWTLRYYNSLNIVLLWTKV